MPYNKCLVNIENGENKVVGDFAALSPAFSEWVQERGDGLSIPPENIIKYIVSCYDPGSDIVREHKMRWMVKKREAAKLSGLLFMHSMNPQEIDSILYCKNDVINRLIIKYITLFNDRDLMMYAIYNEVLINQSRQLMGFDFDKPSDVAKAKENIEAIQSDILKIEERLFSGGDVRELANILQDEAARFMVSELRPENLVSKFEHGDMVTGSPYGDAYEIAPLKFLDDK
jgi:hypothetical protein